MLSPRSKVVAYFTHFILNIYGNNGENGNFKGLFMQK